MPKTKNLLSPDPSWESTVWKRINQGRRELAVMLRRDVTARDLAKLIGLSGPALSGWKRGAKPKDKHLKALGQLFAKAGLRHYDARYLDWGPEGLKGKEAPELDMEPSSKGKGAERKAG